MSDKLKAAISNLIKTGKQQLGNELYVSIQRDRITYARRPAYTVLISKAPGGAWHYMGGIVLYDDHLAIHAILTHKSNHTAFSYNYSDPNLQTAINETLKTLAHTSIKAFEIPTTHTNHTKTSKTKQTLAPTKPLLQTK